MMELATNGASLFKPSSGRFRPFLYHAWRVDSDVGNPSLTLFTPFSGVVSIFLFFCLEETNYDRKTVGVIQDSQSSVDPGIEVADGARDSKATPEKETAVDASQNPIEGTNTPFTRKTYLQKLALLDKPRPFVMHWRSWQILKLLSWPVIFYAGFSYGSYLIWFNVLNGTASVILGGAPYNFSDAIVGLSYLSCIIGVTVASLFSGIFSDWFVIKMARRNKGVLEPEHRLWLFAVPTILLPAGLILWGVGAAHQVHWFGLLFAMFLIAMCNACGVTLSLAYMVDAYRELAGDAMASVIIVRNTMSFAVSYGITPWLDALGYQNCFISVAFVGLAICALFLVMIMYGKAMREKSRVKYWDEVRIRMEKGLVH